MGVTILGGFQSTAAYSDMEVANAEQSPAAPRVPLFKIDDALLRTYEPKLRAVALRFCSSGASIDIDDLIQEGRIALWHAAKLWRQEASLWTYANRAVLTAMVNCATAHIANDPLDVEALSSFDVDEFDTVVSLRAALTQLNAEERQVICSFLQGETFEAIGAAIGKSKSHADRIFRSAVQTLHDCLQ